MTLTITYSNLPNPIVAIYTKICNSQYAIINEKLSSKNKQFVEIACKHLFKSNAPNHIIQFSDLNEYDYEAFKYASNTLNGYNISGDM